MQKIKILLQKYKQFIIYSIIGVSGAVLDLIIFTCLFNVFHINPFLAKTLSTTVGIINNFFWNVKINFKVKDKLHHRFAKFYITGIFGLLLSLLIFAIFINGFGINANLVNLITIIVVVLVQYNINKLIAFKKDE